MGGAPLRLGSFYFGYFLIIGLYLPFWPVWLAGRGFGPDLIGLVLALGLAVRVVAGPMIAFLADRWGRRRGMLVILAMAALLGFAAFLPAQGLWAILVILLWVSATFPAMLPLADTLTLSLAARHGFDYGRVRLWGSLSFIAASLLGGALLARFGTDAVLIGLIAACALTALAATALPDLPAAATVTSSLCKGQAARPGPSWSLLVRLACRPEFLLFLLGVSAIQASHGVYYAFGTLDWQRSGHGEGVIGGLWALGVIAEIVLFGVSGHAVRRVGPVGLLLLGAAAGLLRWSGTALAPGLPALLLLQCLHAFTFGATHLGAMHFLTRAMPPDLAATGQGLLAAMAAGIMLGLATFAAGFLYEAFAARAYFAMAALAAFGGLAILALARRWSGGPLLT